MNTELKKEETQVQSQAAGNYRRPYYRIDGGKEAYKVEVFMPGVSKDDYNVSLHRNELVVEGHKVIPLPTGANWLHREIAPEGYKLRLQLNVDVEPEAIKAKTENGILTITLPVAKEARPRRIKIN